MCGSFITCLRGGFRNVCHLKFFQALTGSVDGMADDIGVVVGPAKENSEPTWRARTDKTAGSRAIFLRGDDCFHPGAGSGAQRAVARTYVALDRPIPRRARSGCDGSDW